ncbi:nuclear transport factor 2 family protein [Streptomyces tibetensis]|uniref:YybH family protein n=1 Tax=Streptomyces tibetensis TaxID=2382123 RepID=UPI0033E4DE64
MPDNTINAHNSAQQLLGLTQRTTGQWLTQIGLEPTRPSATKERTGKNMTPEVVHERFAQYLKDQDLDGLGSLFDEDAMFVPGPGQKPVYGREGIKEALKVYLDSPSTIEVGATSVHQNGDLAMVQASWRITSESGTVEGKALEVMRRTSEGDWGYIIDDPYGV